MDKENGKLDVDPSEDNDELVFDRIMEAVGTRGTFQKRFNWTFNLLVVTMAAMPYMNFVIAMSVPDHWCHVPGRETTNYTLEEWKNLTLPREVNNEGVLDYSQCRMYDYTNGSEVTSCKHGWDYDTTWYARTAPTQENWVCDLEMRVVNIFTFAMLGEVIGTYAFGHIGDTWGRRPAFFLSALTSAVSHCLMPFTASHYTAFVLVSIFASATNAATFQAPLAFSMEVSDADSKGFVMMLQCIGWTLGMVIMPLVAWLVRDWVPFMLITSIPLGLSIFLYRMFPESPRWLAIVGQPERCMESLKIIARTNGTEVPVDAKQQIENIAKKTERVYGLASLFSSWRLLVNTILISICRSVFELAYYSLLLNVSNLAGNPFLNFAWQSVAEFPGYVIGRWAADRYGRRWSQVFVTTMAALANLVAVLIVSNPDISWMASGNVMVIRLFLTVVSYIAYLQSMEAFPTSIRQTGTAVGNVAAGALVVVGPYIAHLGVSVDVRLPFAITGLITLTGALLASFIPETLHVRLPETLSDAQHFGKDQKYWSWIGRRSSIVARKRNSNVSEGRDLELNPLAHEDACK